MKIPTKVNKYWALYFFIKLFYMFFALFVVSKYTTLGDMNRWLNLEIRGNIENIFFNESIFMDYFGAVNYFLFGNIFGNLTFLILSFYGIYYSISKLDIDNKQLVFLLLLLSFPSFGIWSSIAGKEAVSVFFMGLICGYLIDLYKYNKIKPKLIELIAFYLLWLFKSQYFFAIFPIIIYIIIRNKTNIKAFGKGCVFLFYIVSVICFFYFLKEYINELSLMIPKHFRMSAGSTRENIFFVEDYDVFYKMFYGMLLSFMGSSFSEAFINPKNLLVFIESIIILSFFIYFMYVIVVQIVTTKKINITVVFLLFITIFGILFVTYPLGVSNIGSAIRYRENYYGFFVVFIYFLYLEVRKHKYLENTKI